MLAFQEAGQTLVERGFLGLNDTQTTALVLVGLPLVLIAVIAVFAIVFEYLKKVRIVEAETRLKEMMIAQGRPTDEIERVLRAGPAKDSGKE